jgi:hypothetical protein
MPPDIEGNHVREARRRTTLRNPLHVPSLQGFVR